MVLLLLAGAVLYYRTSTSASVVTESPTTPVIAGSPPVVEPEATPSTATPKQSVEPTSAEAPTIQVRGGPITAKPFQTVPIRGTYHGGPNTFVHAQRREGAGNWVVFPLPARTDQLGRFIVHVEIGEVGHHWVRIVDPEKNVKSDGFVVVIEG